MAGLINTYTNSMGGVQNVGTADYGLQWEYNNARSKGLSDDQIATKYGVKAADLGQFHAGFQQQQVPQWFGAPMAMPQAPSPTAPTDGQVFGSAPTAPANTYQNSLGARQDVGTADYGLQGIYNAERSKGLSDDQIASAYGYKAADLTQFHAGYKPSTGLINTPAPAPQAPPPTVSAQPPTVAGPPPGPQNPTLNTNIKNTLGEANINQGIDPGTMTVEGRIGNLLTANNRVIQQAGNRARAAFAQRGLLNSSMAEEAAMEAMTTKAIEIAGPDAAAYLKQSQLNQDWTNKFAQDKTQQGYKTSSMEQQGAIDVGKIAAEYGFRNSSEDKANVAKLQTNYTSAIDGINNNHSTMINAINQMDATQEEKQAMIVNAQNARTSAISFTNAAFARLPGWSKDWLINETPTTQAGAAVNEVAAKDSGPSAFDFVKNLPENQRPVVGVGFGVREKTPEQLAHEYNVYKMAGGGMSQYDWLQKNYPPRNQNSEGGGSD